MAMSMDLGRMQESANEACRLLKTLGNSDRLLLLCQISQGEKCVSELEAALDIRQPTLSQQLTVLRNEELVETRREGKQIYYSLSNSAALEVMSVLYKNYCSK
ncbi:helix-turn-helix transcriptional regulator [Polynucleobacter sp. MWH-UH25E]|uniref:ArsR/SmtB family transcription factor n=1 Tax=Polynucleobacter sp. MWH-UH25E TaxID=1855616 RepID=UPI001BFD2279|nr:metalloregulator ArsR/SmtB family transcription factor [Polynucleobacter sp. MWH-UH25E]QWD62021.1 helix-turn-helix transcriptional regulator [Polynucleobacter sp. MWH-UH25E]